MTSEIIDVSTPIEKTGPKSTLVVSEGRTLFEASRNAKKRLGKQLNFGSAEVVILSEEIAKEGKLGNMIDWFLRDPDCRETICVAISQEDTAGAILQASGTDRKIIGYEINSILKRDTNQLGTTNHLVLYQIFDVLETPGICASIPAMHLVENDGETVCELNGTAVFHMGSLAGYLSPEESRFMLFATDKVENGILITTTLDESDDDEDASMQISENKTKISYRLEDGKPIFHIYTKTKVFVNEVQVDIGEDEEEAMEKIESELSDQISNGMDKIIKRVQKDYGSDIFGFGKIIYQHNAKLWQQLEPQWDNLFPQLTVEVSSKVEVINTATVKPRVKENS